MREKIFLLLMAIVMLSLVWPVQAQQPQKAHRIAWIAFDGSRPDRAFMTALRGQGYVDGQSITVEFRSAGGREERLADIAAELIRLKPEVIVADTNAATHAARKATTTIPIVFMHGDPVWDGTVGSLAQPGKNVTGVSTLSFELAGKRLELLRDTFPKIARVAVLLDADARVHARQFADMEKVARVLGIQLQALPLRNSRLDFDSLFQQAISEGADAFLTLSNPFVSRHRTRVLDFAAKNRLPAIYPDSAFVNAGGLMSYGVAYRELNRRLAYYVDRVLKGAKPSDLPVEQPTKFELVVNLNTAKTLGLTIPAKVLTWADRVVGDGGQVSEKNVASTYSIESPRLKIPRVSVLTPGRGEPSFALEAIRQGLYELGYVEGRNIVLEVRGTAGDDEQRLSIVTGELLRSNVDIIVATNSRQTRAIQQLTRTIPIVMATANDRVGSGFSDSPHRPEGNLTGLSYVGSELNGKRFKLLKETVPGLSRVAILTTSKEASEVQATARSLGLKLQIFTVTKPAEIENAFALMLRGKTDAICVFSQRSLTNREAIVDLAAKNRLPAIYPRREYVETGGLMSYGPNHAELYRRAAAYVDKILKGAKPADLPVERITKTELVINLKTATEIGVTVSPKVLMSADRVIK